MLPSLRRAAAAAAHIRARLRQVGVKYRVMLCLQDPIYILISPFPCPSRFWIGLFY